MAMTSACCGIQFNWTSANTDASITLSSMNVIRYSFNDLSNDFESTFCESRNVCEDSYSLQFLRQGSEETLSANIICKDPAGSQISGISVDSESRTLEISSDKDGYIKTVRGSSLDSISNKKTFACSCTLDNPHPQVTVKFLSLGNKEKVSIRSVMIHMQRHNLQHTDPNAGSSFNLERLKKKVDEMGDSVPLGALDLLLTMETFEKNKLNSLGGVLSHSVLTGGLGLSETNSMPPALSAIMQSVLGTNTIQNLKEDVSTSNSGSSKSESNPDGIYSMLQQVCGKVSASRTASQAKILTSVDTSGEDITTPKLNGLVSQLDANPMLLGILNQKLEEAKQDMASEIHKVKQEVMDHIEGVKRELGGKLDEIKALLHNLQPGAQNPS